MTRVSTHPGWRSRSCVILPATVGVAMLLLTMVVYGREVASLANKLVVQTEALDAGRAKGG
jgi:hypothetical protein